MQFRQSAALFNGNVRRGIKSGYKSRGDNEAASRHPAARKAILSHTAIRPLERQRAERERLPPYCSSTKEGHCN